MLLLVSKERKTLSDVILFKINFLLNWTTSLTVQYIVKHYLFSLERYNKLQLII